MLTYRVPDVTVMENVLGMTAGGKETEGWLLCTMHTTLTEGERVKYEAFRYCQDCGPAAVEK